MKSKAIFVLGLVVSFIGCSGGDPDQIWNLCGKALKDGVGDEAKGMYKSATSCETTDCYSNHYTYHDVYDLGSYPSKELCEKAQDGTTYSPSTGDWDVPDVSGPGSGLGDDSGSSSGTGYGPGCSTTESALKSKCIKPKSGVVDNCVYECEAVCVEKDGCNCGISQYCNGVKALCAAFKGTGCKCSWCN